MQPLKDDIIQLLQRRAAEGDALSGHLCTLIKHAAAIYKAEGRQIIEDTKGHWEAIGQAFGSAAFRQDVPVGPEIVNAFFGMISELKKSRKNGDGRTAPAPSEPGQ